MVNEGLGPIAVIGLGYVGLPLAVALARSFDVIGYDIDAGRIAELRDCRDRTNEVPPEELAASSLRLTDDAEECRGCPVYIVTVPTPVDSNNRPDLGALISATSTVGRLLGGSATPLIIYESTVYPGVTEDICGPVLERESGLSCGRDFLLGYSPERINPGDRKHTLDRIVKVISGQTEAVTDRMAELYGAITSAGVYRAASIKVAEAAKVIENAQRDINIAFMNEVTQIFAALDISIWDVLDAAQTKWNFLPFQPGLVGGHCIGVDPYYLSHRAQELGHEPEVILAGRSINDGMGGWIADRLHEARDCRPGSALIMGITFKEDVPDLRNSRVVDLLRRLVELGHEVTVHDPGADARMARQECGVELSEDALDGRYDLVVAAVPHAEYRSLDVGAVAGLAAPGGTIADLKGMWRGLQFEGGTRYWTL